MSHQETLNQLRITTFDKWKKGNAVSPCVLQKNFGNKIENKQILDPVTFERVTRDSGFLLGNYIYNASTIKNYILNQRLLAHILPGSPDKDEFIISLRGTQPTHPDTRQPLSDIELESIYELLYEGNNTTDPYLGEQFPRTSKRTRGTARKTKKHKKKKHKSKKKIKKKKKN